MKRSIVVAALGTAQTLAWGSSYYLPAILADPIAQGLGLSRTCDRQPKSRNDPLPTKRTIEAAAANFSDL